MERRANEMKAVRIESPEKYINKMKKSITLSEYRASLVVFLFGMCLYFPMLTQRLNCSDGNLCGIFYRSHIDYDIEDIAGRYLLKYFAHMKSMFVFSWMAVLFGVLCITVGSIFAARIFRINSTLNVVATGLFFMVAPCFIENFVCYFAADAYLLSFPLTILAAYLLHEKITTIRLLFASGCMFVSMASYQAYIFVTITLFVFILIRDLLEEQKSWKQIGKKVSCQVASVGIAFVAYVLGNKILKMVGLINYQESRFELMELLNPFALIGRIDDTYKAFFDYFFTMNIINNVWKGRHIVNAVIVALGIILLILGIYRRKLAKSKILGICGALLILPLTMMGISLLYNVNIMILPAANLLYVAVISLWEHERFVTDGNIRNVCGWGVYICTIWLIFVMSTYLCIYQICMKYYVDKTDAMAQRIIMKIEETYPDLGAAPPVFICGDVDEGNYPRDYNIEQASYILIGTQACAGMFVDNMQGYFAGWNAYMAANLGVEYTKVGEKAWEIYDSDFYKEMPLFPADGSIKKNEDGIIVVKMKP